MGEHTALMAKHIQLTILHCDFPSLSKRYHLYFWAEKGIVG